MAKQNYIWLLFIAIIIGGLVFASSTQDKNLPEITEETSEEETVAPEVREYFITAEGKYLIGSRSFNIEGATDLPDGAMLSVTIYDTDHHTHDDADMDWRMENLTHISEDLMVRNGSFASIVEASEFEAPLKSDTYTVEVSFNPRSSSQPSDVVNITGKNGEYLAGSLVDKSIIGLQTLEFTNSINIKSDTKSFTEWKNPKAKIICTEYPSWKVFECEAVAESAIWIGMSYEMLTYSFGEPDLKSPSNYGSGIQWQWCWHDMNPSCFYDKNDDGLVDSYN